MSHSQNFLPEPDSPVVVALSGGVDSSVAAWRLRERGHRVRAVFMKNWEEDDENGYCAAAEDLADAEAVCRLLDVELRTVNFSTEYWDNVFAQFLSEYRAGRTPNPDVLCNREIKFNVFMDFALSDTDEWLATGHYACLEHAEDTVLLTTAADTNKDQTYFLHSLRAEQLTRVTFPIGDLDKSEVRTLASRAGLPTSEKKDSTGICFIGERPFRAFLERYVDATPGPIIDTDGHQVGEHDGLAFYTPGQRQGLGIGGRRGSSGAPWYVVGKDLVQNILVVAEGKQHPSLYHTEVTTSEPSWIAGRPPSLPLRASAKLRYRQPAMACCIESQTDGRLRVQFDEPQWAPAPGQSAVFYDGNVCLGGAVIEALSEECGAKADQLPEVGHG